MRRGCRQARESEFLDGVLTECRMSEWRSCPSCVPVPGWVVRKDAYARTKQESQARILKGFMGYELYTIQLSLYAGDPLVRYDPQLIVVWIVVASVVAM